MPASTPDPDTVAAGDEFVVEAPSVEAALADVVARTGQQPEVLEVDRVVKGGIGGFFAKEVARVRVRLGGESDAAGAPAHEPAGGGPAVAQPPSERVATARIHGVEAVLAAMTADADAREVSFGEVLRRELNDGRDPLDAAREHTSGGLFAAHPLTRRGVAPSTEDELDPEPDAEGSVQPPASTPLASTPLASTPPASSPAVDHQSLDAPRELTTGTTPASDTGERGEETEIASSDEHVDAVAEEEPDRTRSASAPRRRARRAVAADQLAGPAWSMPALYRLGLPASLLDRVEVPEEATDGAWLAAVARAVAPLCGALPNGTQALIGPDADLLGQALSVPVTAVGGNPPYGGDVALVATDRADDLAWIDRVMGDRWRHVVVSDREARGLVSDDVEAVSWVGSQCLPEAIGLALTCGLVLGHGLRGVGSDVVRATPLDVAIGLRDLLPRIEHRREGSR